MSRLRHCMYCGHESDMLQQVIDERDGEPRGLCADCSKIKGYSYSPVEQALNQLLRAIQEV